MTRRSWLTLFAGTAAAGEVSWSASFRAKAARFLERHRRPEGAYGWSSDVIAHITPTFGVIGSYRLLGIKPPAPERVADFARNVYPVPEVRRKDRPLWRMDFEQVQTLSWLDKPIDSFRPLAATWNRSAAFTKVYEMGGNPVFQHQAMAVRVRRLLGLTPSEEDSAWREYFLARRRPDGTFNATPAADGSGGHVMNTLWGLQAAECLGIKLSAMPELAGWIKTCQLASGGFTYAPKASLGGLEDIAYTWCALQILERLDERPNSPAQCAAWVESLFTPEGGFQDRPGGEPNPLATFYALDSLRLLKHTPKQSFRYAERAKRNSIPAGSEVFSIQVQAPGNGSPREAALLAGALGIHLWTAKNSAPGWIEEAQKAAEAARVPVQFGVASEEYGLYVAVPGMGCYSHLVDLVAPYEPGKSVVWKRSDRRPDLVTAPGLLEKTEFPYPWDQFRDSRIAALKNARGRMIWQKREFPALTAIPPPLVWPPPLRRFAGRARSGELVVGRPTGGLHHSLRWQGSDVALLARSAGPQPCHGRSARCGDGMENTSGRRIAGGAPIREAARNAVAVVGRARQTVAASPGRHDSAASGDEV